MILNLKDALSGCVNNCGLARSTFYKIKKGEEDVTLEKIGELLESNGFDLLLVRVERKKS